MVKLTNIPTLMSANEAYKMISDSKSMIKKKKKRRFRKKSSSSQVSPNANDISNDNIIIQQRKYMNSYVVSEALSQNKSENLQLVKKKSKKSIREAALSTKDILHSKESSSVNKTKKKKNVEQIPQLIPFTEKSSKTNNHELIREKGSVTSEHESVDDEISVKSIKKSSKSTMNKKSNTNKENRDQISNTASLQSFNSKPFPRKYLSNINFLEVSMALNLKINTVEEIDSAGVGDDLFTWLLSSVSPKEFFIEYWEKNALLIKGDEGRFDGLFSCEEFDWILRKNNIQFTKNVDITSYRDGVRETHNPEGRALATVVWDFYNSGCSVRFLNPQTYSEPVWGFLARLQEFFHSFCGANVYLTPPGTQGFAPHWDDIEAFVLQLEGSKRWRVYQPRNIGELLARESSRNFGPDDDIGNPVIDCVLEPGDLLYFPRGFIHQAEAVEDAHSLHITISTYQKNSWHDLLEKVLPLSLAKATAENVSFRRGLPRMCFREFGAMLSSSSQSRLRKEFKSQVKNLVAQMMTDSVIDDAIDQLAKGFIHDSLPPNLNEVESMNSVFEGGERWCGDTNEVVNQEELHPESRVRLLRRACVRLLVEEGGFRLYYSVENSREYHADEPKYLEIEPDVVPGLRFIINSYPKFVAVENLPLDNLEEKMALVIGLWEKGLLMTDSKVALESSEDESESSESDPEPAVKKKSKRIKANTDIYSLLK